MGFSQSLFMVPTGGDILQESQISAEYRYIEIIKGFEIFGIIVDIKLIHAT